MHFHVTDSHEAELRERVFRIVTETPVDDIHTHLYDPAFEKLLLWGIDELLIYHYLVAEGFRPFGAPDHGLARFRIDLKKPAAPRKASAKPSAKAKKP